jgi:hypothetical protein
LIFWFLPGDWNDPLVVNYVYRGGRVVGLLALAQKDWDWAHARGCDASDVWKGVPVSFYVDAGVVDSFVTSGSDFVILSPDSVTFPAWLFFGLSLPSQ